MALASFQELDSCMGPEANLFDITVLNDREAMKMCIRTFDFHGVVGFCFVKRTISQTQEEG